MTIMARATKNTAPVAEVAAPAVEEPIVTPRTRTAAEVRAELAALEAAEAEAAAKVEEERVAALKFSFESLNEAFDAAESNLEAFEAGLSVADRALLGIKTSAPRTPKGAAIIALRAHVETMAPGAVFELKDLPETATLGATPGTVYKALRALGVQVTGKGKGSKYHVPGVGVPEEDTSGTNKPTDEEPPAEPTGGVGYASFPAQS